MRVTAIICLLPAILATVAVAQDDHSTSALINEALDKSVSLQLDGVLPDVLKTIENKTSVRIQPADGVYDLLPWGEQTNIKATVENQTLRQALTAIAQKLGLKWELGDYEVWLKPIPALARLGRRATIAELDNLYLLRTTPIDLKKDKLTVQELVDAIDRKLAQIKGAQVAVDLRAGDPSNPQAGFIKLDQSINIPRNASMTGALEDLTRQTDATWYPWGKYIVIVPKQEQIRTQLDRTITARWNGLEIGQVLEKLAKRSGVPFTIEPGAIQRVPVEYRSIRLQLENVTIRQVLDNIRGLTGLDYLVKPDGVYIWNQNPNPGVARSPSNDPVVAMITIQDGVQLFIRESDLPADVRAYLSHKTQQQVEALRRQMKSEGFAPTTRPAPANAPPQ